MSVETLPKSLSSDQLTFDQKWGIKLLSQCVGEGGEELGRKWARKLDAIAFAPVSTTTLRGFPIGIFLSALFLHSTIHVYVCARIQRFVGERGKEGRISEYWQVVFIHVICGGWRKNLLPVWCEHSISAKWQLSVHCINISTTAADVKNVTGVKNVGF